MNISVPPFVIISGRVRHWIVQPVDPIQEVPLHQHRVSAAQQVRLLQEQHLLPQQHQVRHPVRKWPVLWNRHRR